MNTSAVLLILALSVTWFLIEWLDALNDRSPSKPVYRVVAFVLVIFAAVAPILGIQQNFLEQSAPNVLIAGIAFFLFSLRRHRLFWSDHSEQVDQD